MVNNVGLIILDGWGIGDKSKSDAIFNAASSTYTINNAAATKQQVAQYLTASAAQKLLTNTSTTHNATNNVTHSVVVRTIALHNINSITANKQTLNLN